MGMFPGNNGLSQVKSNYRLSHDTFNYDSNPGENNRSVQIILR